MRRRNACCLCLRHILISGAFLVTAALLAAPTPEKPVSLSLRGLIGKKFPASMVLNRTGNALTGEYFYEKRKDAYVPGALELVGKQDAGGKVTLLETDASGNRTGTVTGRIVSNVEGGPVRFEGTWVGADGKRSMSVVLTERNPEESPDGARLLHQPSTVTGKNPTYTLSWDCPRLVGANGRADADMEPFNSAARSLVRSLSNDFRKFVREDDGDQALLPDPKHGYEQQTSYTVASLTPRAVSVSFEVYADTGGAHPNTSTHTLNFDRRAGKRLRLADLFRPGFHYLPYLSQQCRAALHDDFKRTEGLADVPFPEGVKPVEANFANWTMMPQGLNIHFDRYQVAAYAEGDRDVILPWPMLKSCLRPDSPAAPLVDAP